MRISPLAILAIIAGCAQPVPPPASPAPAAVAAPAPIYTPNPIQPRLLPGIPGSPQAAPLNPAQQAGQTLQQGMRQDQRRDQLNAVDPNRPQDFGNPSALGGTNPFNSDMGDAQYPGIPAQPAPIFRRF